MSNYPISPTSPPPRLITLPSGEKKPFFPARAKKKKPPTPTSPISPTEGAPSSSSLFAPRPADDSLSLAFVHGFRGFDDCCDNLFYASTGEVVFHAAGVGALHNAVHHRQRFYFGHDDDIISLALHPTGSIAATGQVGKDPPIKVWRVADSSTLSTLEGQHARGVCCLDFSGCGKFLASVGLDDDHSLVLWDWEKEEAIQSSRCHKDKVFNVKFNPHDSNRLVSVGVKHIKFWVWTPPATPTSQSALVGRRGAFGRSAMGAASDNMHCVAFGARGDVCFTGSSAGEIFVWSGQSLSKRVKAHEGGCFALDFLDDILASGGKDGVFKLWNENMTKCLKVVSLQNSELSPDTKGFLTHDLPAINAIDIGTGRHTLVGTRRGEVLEVNRNGNIRVLFQGHTGGELWGLAAHPSKPIFATCSEDKTLRVWDLISHKMLTFKTLHCKAFSCSFTCDGNAIAVGFNDGSFVVVDAETLDDIIDFHDREERINDVKFSPDDSHLAVASSDNFVDIYSVFTSRRVGVCRGASSYVTHVDWEESGELLQLNSGAREHLFFQMPKGRRCVVNRADQPNIRWATMTCVLGEGVEGIFPPESDVTDVNAAARSTSGDLVATGDDFGLVKLFRFPARGKHAPHKRYGGHSSHVTNVRWSHDDAFLVSAGGGDATLMVWRHVGREEGVEEE